MGLMYVFPVAEDETDFYIKKDESLVLKTYGLPYVFWFYALCSIAVIGFMFLAIKEPVLKLISLGDDTDATLGYALLSFVGLLPVTILGFFFYEKRIIRSGDTLRLVHRVFGIIFFSETFPLESADALKVEAFLDSPNVAKMKGDGENLGFQNKGYFILWLTLPDGKRIQLDRHSRKVDLEKLKKLIIEI